VNLSASLVSIGVCPFAGCSNLTAITVDGGNPSYKHSEDHKMLLDKAGTALISYPSATGAVTLSGITSIGGSAFYACRSLASVSLPAATSIGDHAFTDCDALASVSLPVAASIGDLAFFQCSALTTVNLPAAASIGYRAFSNTSTQALTVTLGNTVPVLGTDMFLYVNTAKSVTVQVPSGVAAWNGKTGTFSGSGTDNNWGSGFRGGGWNGTAMTDSGLVNSNINLTVTAQ
jgi:hypothetical protein